MNMDTLYMGAILGLGSMMAASAYAITRRRGYEPIRFRWQDQSRVVAGVGLVEVYACYSEMHVVAVVLQPGLSNPTHPWVVTLDNKTTLNEGCHGKKDQPLFYGPFPEGEGRMRAFKTRADAKRWAQVVLLRAHANDRGASVKKRHKGPNKPSRSRKRAATRAKRKTVHRMLDVGVISRECADAILKTMGAPDDAPLPR